MRLCVTSFQSNPYLSCFKSEFDVVKSKLGILIEYIKTSIMHQASYPTSCILLQVYGMTSRLISPWHMTLWHMTSWHMLSWHISLWHMTSCNDIRSHNICHDIWHHEISCHDIWHDVWGCYIWYMMSGPTKLWHMMSWHMMSWRMISYFITFMSWHMMPWYKKLWHVMLSQLMS